MLRGKNRKVDSKQSCHISSSVKQDKAKFVKFATCLSVPK